MRALAEDRPVSPGRQVLTIFGDYWWHVSEFIPSAALVAALGDLDVADGAARATLSRLTRAGILVNSRNGRRTAYGLSPRGSAIVDAQSVWLENFGRTVEAWDGSWSVVAFSVPEAQRSRRHQVRSRLRWLGYAPLHDGLWISPQGGEELVMDELRALGAGRITAFRATDLRSEPLEPQQAWDLADLAARYRSFVERLGPPVTPTPAVALHERMQVILEWQRFRVADPGLPIELLPADWPRRDARRMFVERYGALASLAEARMREHVAAVEPRLADLVTHRRFQP